MSGRGFIDGLDFARHGRELQGEFAAAAFERLQDCLYDDSGVLAYRLQGGSNDRQQPVIDIAVRGALHLRCQRCLGAYDFSVDVQRRLVLVTRAGELPDPAEEEEQVDTVLAEPQMEIAALIEDEILLCLPISPRHDDAACVAPRPTGDDAARVDSPFAALTQLQRRNPARR